MVSEYTSFGFRQGLGPLTKPIATEAGPGWGGAHTHQALPPHDAPSLNGWAFTGPASVAMGFVKGPSP